MYGAQYGATVFRALCFLVVICPTTHCLVNFNASTDRNVETLYLFQNSCYFEVCTGRYPDLSSTVRVNCTWDSRSRFGFCIAKWSKHGKTVLAIPSYNPLMDVTVCMDVHPNPGPVVNDRN